MDDVNSRAQQAFAAALSRVLRESRGRQKLTQADVSARTNGLVSRAALAGYETGHRALRVQDLAVITQALGVDIATVIAAAERSISISRSADTSSAGIDIDVTKVNASSDPRLSVIKRWIELRVGSKSPVIHLDAGAIAALSSLMNVRAEEARRLFEAFSTNGIRFPPAATTSVTTGSGRASSSSKAQSAPGLSLPAQPTAPMADETNGPVTIRVSEVIASGDPQVRLLKSWVEMRLSQSNADRLTIDTNKITGLSLLMDMSPAEVRQFLKPFLPAPSRR